MNVQALKAVATSIRMLTIDAVETATSGHPGMPMGCAELGAVLYGEILKHYNQDPQWIDRDRFVLSAGHGSLLLYSLIHLSGYGLTKEDIARFRRIGSLTPGHPEYGHTMGVETTTGPLGAGFATAVGMAIAEKKLAHRFNTRKHTIIDHYTYVISGDGCFMEGVTAEAASLAGHLKLGKLIVFYDSNRVTIEGATDITFTEDVAGRFRAYKWQTLEGDAYDIEQIARLVEEAKREREKPTLILLKSVIGRGSPNLAGHHKVHGTPLGKEEVKATRRALGCPEDVDFYTDPRAVEYFQERQSVWKQRYDAWQEQYNAWASENPDLKKELEIFLSYGKEYYALAKLPRYEAGQKHATRDVSGAVIKAYADAVKNFIGGSADLASTTKTEMPGHGEFSAEHIEGKTIRFGVREHAMASIVNGITLHGGYRTFCGTLVVFADYMRPPMRLAALMKLPVVYVLTHDSIYVGGDGPTHQPIEHLTSLRIIPNMMVLRPGDAEETVEAWRMAMDRLDGPTVLALSRQPLLVYTKKDKNWKETMRKGAYVVADCAGRPDVIVVGTGSEVELALKAGASAGGKKLRIVSMISRELFLQQDKAFRESILIPGVRTVVAEAGVTCAWEGIASSPEDVFGINAFGVSGPGEEVAAYLGFTAEALAKLIRG